MMPKLLDAAAFEKECGKMIPVRRNMSTFEGDHYECACGRQHTFSGITNVLSEGFNGRFLVVCSHNPKLVSLIKTKMKFGMVYQGLEYLAGCQLTL